MDLSRALSRLVLGVLLVAGATQRTKGQEILYGGSGVGATDNVGALFTVNQTNGSGTLVGTPVNGFGLSGISFNSLGLLYGTTVGGAGFASSLILIDPSNGSLLLNIGTIMAGTQALKIGDLAFQPTTGLLYGITAGNGPTGSPGAGFLYTINLATATATLIGDTGSGVSGGLGFASNGTLYSTSASALRTLNPLTGATTSSVALSQYYDALGVRPSDGLIFASPGNSGLTYTIDPTTGSATSLGATNLDNAVSDLAFSVAVPEPGSIALLSLGGTFLVTRAAKRKR